MLKVLIVDDHYLVGEGTKKILESDGEFTVKYVSSGKEALLLSESFDVYIVDIHMPDMNGMELSERLLKIDPERKIILYTGYDNQDNLSLFSRIGVSGIISKTATKEELTNLIEHILDGKTIVPLSIFKGQNKIIDEANKMELTERDLLILRAISEGQSNKEIANELFIADRTVEYRLTQIYKRLGVATRTEAVKVAVQSNLIAD